MTQKSLDEFQLPSAQSAEYSVAQEVDIRRAEVAGMKLDRGSQSDVFHHGLQGPEVEYLVRDSDIKLIVAYEMFAPAAFSAMNAR